MRVLFPSQPFEPKSADSAFAVEREAAERAGLGTHLVNAEALDGAPLLRRSPEGTLHFGTSGGTVPQLVKARLVSTRNREPDVCRSA